MTLCLFMISLDSNGNNNFKKLLKNKQIKINENDPLITVQINCV